MIYVHESSTAAMRSVFIIDPEKNIRLSLAYPLDVGRNLDEILRVIDALYTGDAKHIATPADWTPGDKVMIPPSIKTPEADKLFPKSLDEVNSRPQGIRVCHDRNHS